MNSVTLHGILQAIGVVLLSISALSPASGQTNPSPTPGSTNIAISGTTLQPSVKRFGINLGNTNNYDSGQMLKNLIVGNPGFEGQIWNSTIMCSSGTTSSCTDYDQYSGWPAHFWAGATFQVFYGTAAGRTGIIADSTAAVSATQGMVLNFTDSKGTAPASMDYMVIRKTFPGGASQGWQTTKYGNGTVGDNTSDLPPNSPGKQTVVLNAPTAQDFAQIQTSFDATPSRSFLQLNGTYQIQFKAKGLGGSNQILVNLTRGTSTPYVNEAVSLSGDWNTYNLTFTATEDGTFFSPIGLTFSTVYSPDSFELDDVSVTQTNGDPSNTTVFRDPVVSALRLAQPGILRFWDSAGQLGETLDNMLAPQFGRQRAGFSAFFPESDILDYGLHEFLTLCQTVGAEPWIVVPTTFSTTDAANLIEYLAGTGSTIYGAKRASLGQTTPWTQVFTKIHLEFGNEAWNSTFEGGDILYAEPYGKQAQIIFAAMQSDSSYNQTVAPVFDFVLGGTVASPGYNHGIQDFVTNNTSFTVAPYTMNTVDSAADNESLFGSTFAEPEALMSSSSSAAAEKLSPGEVYQNVQQLGQSSNYVNNKIPLSYYEINMSTLQGNITQTELDGYTSSLGAGLMVVDTMLQSLKQYGVVNQSLFALPQYSQTGMGGKTAYIWGSVVDMGVTDRKRPQFLALELANQALSAGATMLTTTHSGTDPTWDVSKVTNTVTYTGAHYLQSYAFQQGNNFSLIVFNLSRSASGSLPVTFTGTNAPSGTVLMQQLTSTNITDTNENSSLVSITPATLTGFSSSTGLTLPPYSMTVLTWSTSTSAPVISGVTVSGITGTSATVSWTTDEAATSVAQYGTTASYGSSSATNSTLSRNHSVTLTGLTQGTTYDFSVTSANATAQSASSPNSTFTTPLAAPVIAGVAVSNTTPTSATITWTTNQASTSLVAYLASGSFSSVNADSNLLTSHSLTLTGLTASTTYNFTVTSANSAGTPTTATGYSFSTVSAPVISAVTVNVVTSSTATITWTTDQPSSSQVLYGTGTGYGASSTPNSNLVTSHSVMLTKLGGSTTYDFQVISANTYGLSASSANYTFATASQGPVISYVYASAINSTSATINWTTDQSSSTVVNYGTTSSYGSSVTAGSTVLATSHSITITGLTLGTTYNYQVFSQNTTGVSAASANFTFSTAGGTAATNIAITTTPLQSSVKRLGITLGTLNNYDSGQMTKNLIIPNPGFEGQIWNSIVLCASGTATSCTDQNAYSLWPAGFWTNASYQVVYGAGATRSGIVSSSTASDGSSQGVTLNFGDSGTALSSGTYVILRKTVSGGSSAGWQVSTSSAGTVTDSTDVAAGSAGHQSIELQAPTPNDYATITTTFDNSGSGKSFVQLNGTYQLQFKAKALGGSNALGIILQRSGGSTFLNQNLSIGSSWTTYSLPFTAAESGATGGVSLFFKTIFGQDYIELDDVSLTQTNGDPSNPTVFRDSVVNALKVAQPGILRYWGGNGQLGETLDNLLTTQFGRQRAGYSEYFATSTQIDYSLHAFLVLCQTLGAEPWFVVPTTFSNTDAANLIEYLAGSSSTTYGAKRVALGQTNPWTQVFPKIHLEFGEQAWNYSLSGGNITSPAAYAAQASAIFTAMRGSGSYSASSFDLVLGGQAAMPADIATIQNGVTTNDSFDIEPYTMNTVDSFSTTEALFGPTFAEPEALMSTKGTAESQNPGMVYQDYQAIQQSSRVVPLSFSEINMSTLSGAITTDPSLNTYVNSLGAGLMVADTMLQGLKQFGVVNQSLYSLAQYTSTTTERTTVDLFGSVVDMGVTDLRRPQFLSLALANQALSSGATMLATNHTGADPTWDQPLLNSVFFNGAHYLQSFAFQNGTSFSTVIFNLSRTSSLPVTFGGANAPTGAVQMQQLTSGSLTDTNETANAVKISSSTMSSFSGTTGLTLPAYSMTILNWSTSTTGPAISAVSATGITGTSAIITWTTDQPSTSQVNYGTTSGYGLVSNATSTLSTSHSVTLTGLTAGTTYNFQVVSANSASTSAFSSNSTFTTPAAAPVISAVNIAVLSSTSATITWTTDQSATSILSFGTTTSYGSTVEDATLVTSHSVTLYGLTSGATYDLDVTSANSAGLFSTSANYSFTAGTPPVISNLIVSAITASSATISWTTNPSTNALVNYGTTLAYGLSAKTTDYSTTHSITVTGLSVGTTYNYDVVSANSVGTYTTSINATFTTTTAVTVISNVVATATSSTSETITWTTDQAASSLVNYGTGASYGTQSTSATLVTNHSVLLSGLTAGTTYNFDVVSTNTAGTATSANSTFATTAVAVISNVVATATSSTSETITWTTDQAASSLVNYGTGASYGTQSTSATLVTNHSVLLSGLTAGTTYNFDVVSTNTAGTATSANSTFATTAVTVISNVVATATSSTSETITWTTDQAASSLVNYGTGASYGTQSTSATLVTNHSVLLSGLTAGTTYNFDVVSTNTAGTATSANSTFSTTAVAVISNVVATATSSTSETITWTTDQAASSLVNYGTGASYGTQSTSATLVTNHSVLLSGLTAGTTYNFDVVSTNTAGTATSANSTFATTAVAVISNVVATATSSTSETITWTTDQAASSLVNYGTGASYGTQSTSATLVTNHSVLLSGLTAGTTYNFDVVSTNTAGTATSANSTFATTAVTVISNVVATATSSTSETITWTTDQAASSLVNYGTGASYGTQSTSATLVTNHSVLLSGLTAGTTYNFDVVSTNTAGTATSANSTFATTAVAVISNVVATATSSTSETITWTTDQAASSLVNYGTGASYGTQSTSATLVTNHSVLLSGLTAGTTYNFDVVSTNTAGTATSANSTFATTAVAVISNVVATATSSTSETITWTTDQAASSLVNYGTGTSYGTQSTSATLVTNHSVLLSGLTAGTTYNFDVVSTNTAGTATSANSTFATTAVTVISNVVATATSSTSETITWTTDQAASSLVNYGTGASYGTQSTSATLVTNHSVLLSGLTAGTTYNFDVVSTNTAGTATSANSTFATTAGTPLITVLTATAVSSTSETITWTTDQATSSLVNYGTSKSYGSASALNTTLVMSHSVTLTGLTANTLYDFDVVSANSASTSVTSSNQTFTTQLDIPSITSVTATAVSNTSETITWTTNEAASSQVNYGATTTYGSSSTLNSTLATSHSVTLTGLTAGTTYNFDVASTNAAGNPANSPNATFTTLASTATPPFVGYVASWGINNTGLTVSWSTDVAATAVFAYGTTPALGQFITLQTNLTTSHGGAITGLNPGTTYYYVPQSTAANGATGYAAQTYSFTTTGMSTAPAPVISSVIAGTVTGNSATITWATDVASTSQVNYGTSSSYGSSTAVNSTLTTSHSVTLTGLLAGTTYNFDVVSANSGTSATSSNYAFTTVPGPTISAVTATSVSNNSETITWTTSQQASAQVNYGTTTTYGMSTTPTTTSVTAQSVTLTGLTAGTTYNYQVVSANSAGTATTSANYTFTTTGTAPAPIISNVVASGTTSSAVTITWTTDQATSSLVNYGTTASLGTSSAANSSLVTSHSVTLSGLTTGTTYYFDVVSANAASVSATSTNSTFTTLVASGPAPQIGYLAFWGVNNSGVTISWSTDVNATTQIAYGTTTALGQLTPLQTTLAASHGVVLTGLNSGTTYYFVAQSTGSNGVTGYSTSYNFTTTGTASSSAPAISAVTSSGLTSTSATITWTTDQASSSQVNYGTSTSYGSSSTTNASLVTSHSVSLTGLTAGTTYNFDVVSANSGGTSSTSTNYTFATPASTGTAPVISAVTATAISASSATITWTTDQASSSQVNYGTTTSYGTASAVNTALTMNHSVTLTGLTAGTTYDFDVVSAISGGASTTSPNATFVTSAPAGTPPVITAVNAGSITTSSVTITWTTDQASSSQVNYGTSTAYGSASTLNSTLTTSHSVTLSGLAAGMTYNFDVVSVTSGGNTATSGNSTFATTATTATPPNIGYLAYYGISNTGVTISWSTDVSATTQLAYGTTKALGQLTALQTTMAASHGVVLTGLNPGTTYYFVAQSTGANGATGYSTTYSFTTTGTSTTPAPVISAVTATNIGNATATITWTTDQASSSQVNYGTTTSYGSSSTANTSQVTSHSVVLSALTAGTTYSFDVVSANSSGPSATSTNYTFTTTGTAPAPVISAVAATSITSSSVTITWNTDQAASSLVNYGVASSYGSSSTLNPSLVTSHSVTLTGLTASTIYNFDVVSANAGSASTTSGNSTFTTTAASTSTGPVISSIVVTPQTGNTANISWTTSVPANSYVQFGPAAGSYNRYASQTSLTTSPSCPLGYVPSGVIHYQLVSMDAAGHMTLSTDATFTEP